MKKIIITTISTIFIVSLFFIFSSKIIYAGSPAVCTYPRGGFPYAGYGTVCLEPNDYSDAISGLNNNLSYCQVYQDDNQMPQGIYTYKSEGPRGTTCTLVAKIGLDATEKDTCSCSDGSACANGGSIDNLTSETPWNFAECSKCDNSKFQANWNQTAGSVSINVSADNWRPILHNTCIGHCGGNSGDPIWDSYVTFPDSYLDFKFQVFESGNTTAIKETVVSPNADPPTNMTCVYHTVNAAQDWTYTAYRLRDNTNNYVTCSLSNYQITGLTFQTGKTYSVKTSVKAHYADDTQWIDYLPDGTPTGKNYNVCQSSLVIPAATLTPTPTGVPACVSLTSNNNSPSLGETIGLTCNKNADYTGAVTYNFRLIHKNSAADTDPSPLPTPFVQNSTNEDETYEFPTGQYGYYAFQCQVCAGAFCTDWQNPPSPTPTVGPTNTPSPTPTLTSCVAPNLNCSGTCVDTSMDVINCGACGNACSTGQLCVSGACYSPPASPTLTITPTPTLTACPAPNLNCNNICTDSLTDTQNCGACGNACSAGQLCVSGACYTP